MSHLLSHDLPHKVVEVPDRPSTVFEAAAIVFPWATRSLHNTIERDERQNDELSHVRSSLLACC